MEHSRIVPLMLTCLSDKTDKVTYEEGVIVIILKVISYEGHAKWTTDCTKGVIPQNAAPSVVSYQSLNFDVDLLRLNCLLRLISQQIILRKDGQFACPPLQVCLFVFGGI